MPIFLLFLSVFPVFLYGIGCQAMHSSLENNVFRCFGI